MKLLKLLFKINFSTLIKKKKWNKLNHGDKNRRGGKLGKAANEFLDKR